MEKIRGRRRGGGVGTKDIGKGRRNYRVGHPFFSKERNFLAFFSVLYKRTEQSLSSFPFFIKE